METNNNVSPEKKSSILNSMAIAGFVGAVLLLAWLSVQLVQLFPSAFSSLASLAEGVNQSAFDVAGDSDMESIVITGGASLVKTGESVTINWQTANRPGSYVFAYECIEGIAVAQVDAAVERQLACATNYNVGDVTSLSLVIASEKNRYTDVPYTISFLRTNDTQPRATGADTLTVINDSINGFVTNPAPEPVTPPVAVVEPAPVVPAAPVVVTPAQPVFEQQFVYEIPTSNPNGTTDLATSFIAMGEVINNRFVQGPVSVRNAGAVQFEVKNIGTKTSTSWTYTVTLPTGSTYSSTAQVALKPNERAVLTIGFPAGASTPHTFVVQVKESTDRNSRNNTFSQRVTFAR